MNKIITAMLIAAVFTGSAEAVVISFEQEEGFPAPAAFDSGKGVFTDLSTNKGIVLKWTNESKAKNYWFVDDGPGGFAYPEAPAPISGTQVASFGSGGPGITTGAIFLNKNANLCLESFYWAYRGSGDSRPGGDAYLELEYFDINEKSLGKEKFQGGLASDWTPKFELAKTSQKFQGVPLSMVIFRGVPPEPETNQHGTFFLDDVTLEKREPKPELTLVKDGQAVATIVVPRISIQWGTDIIAQDPDHPVSVPKDADQWATKSALWLQEYVRKASGAELKIVAEEDKVPLGNLISIGHTKLAEKAGIGVDDLKWSGCKLVVRGNVLYLIGRDNMREKKQNPARNAKGTAKAVVTFLEDFCGVRWFLQGPEGEFVPRVSSIGVPMDLSRTVVPIFTIVDGRFPYDPGFLADGGVTAGAIANNYRVGISAITGGHTYYGDVPTSKYFKDHPEYFALINGKRTGEGNHLCSTNPDVRRIIVEEIRKKFDEGFEIVALGQEDGYRRCECQECEKLDNYRWPEGVRGEFRDWEKFSVDPEGLRKTPCERLFIMHKWIIDEVRKTHPDKKVSLMAYAPTAWPSKVIDKWPDNVMVEIHLQEPEVIEAWKGKAEQFGVAQVYWFNITLPMGMYLHATPKEAAKRLREVYDSKAIGLLQYQETNWGLQGPVFYAIGKMMGDINADPKALVEEYCRGVYGNAAGTMMQFFDRLYTRHEGLLTYDQRLGPIRHPRAMSTTDLTLLYYPPSHLKQLEHLLQKAEGEADTDRAKGWLRLTRDHFDFINLITKMLVYYQAYQVDSTRENWLALKKKVEDFEAYRMKIINYPKEWTDVWFPGYDYFCNFLTADAQHESKIYYVPWEKRKPDVLKKGVKGMAIGYGGTFGYNYIKEPLTMDFSKEEGR